MSDALHSKSEADTASANELTLSDGEEYLKLRGIGALAERMEIVFTEFTRERAVATMPVLGNTQPIGLLHGGAYVVLGESLGSMHANFLAPEGYVAVGIDINATHTGSARTGTVTGVCIPVHTGRTLTVHEIVVTDERGRRCSTVRITNLYRKIRKTDTQAGSN